MTNRTYEFLVLHENDRDAKDVFMKRCFHGQKLQTNFMGEITHNQTQLFLGDNNILYKYQSGFRKYYSTDICLSYLNNKVQIGFERGLMIGMILIGLQKDFHTIDNDILSEKMHCLGFS